MYDIIQAFNMSAYGSELNPYRAERRAFAVKGVRTSVVATHNPSTIDQGQLLVVKFPELGVDDVIVPGTMRIGFDITLTNGDGAEPDPNRTIVNNLGRSIVNKINVKLGSKDIYCLDEADRYLCYRDLWLTDKERTNRTYQGIQNTNTGRIRVGAGDADAKIQPDSSIADTYKNRFCIPLDFELLTDHMPFYPYGLTERLSFELTFSKYEQVIVSTNKKASYQISDISLEYDKVTNTELAKNVRQQYMKKVVILYERVVRVAMNHLNKSDPSWNITIELPINSLKGILLLFEDPAVGAMGPAYGRDSEFFYNPLITKVEVSVGGVNNQLFDKGLAQYQHWSEMVKGFARETLKDAESPSTDHTTYFQNRYGLWIDFRMSEDHTLHGSGRRIGDGGIVLRMERKVQAPGALHCHAYLVMDGQLNIGEGKYQGIVY